MCPCNEASKIGVWSSLHSLSPKLKRKQPMCHLLFLSSHWLKCGHSESELALIVKRKTVLSDGGNSKNKKQVESGFLGSLLVYSFPFPPTCLLALTKSQINFQSGLSHYLLFSDKDLQTWGPITYKIDKNKCMYPWEREVVCGVWVGTFGKD